MDLPPSIECYQKVLHYAHSEVNFIIGISLYMVPSNMLLHKGQVEGYNNEIVKATSEQILGVNKDISSTPTAPSNPIQGRQVWLCYRGALNLFTLRPPQPSLKQLGLLKHMSMKMLMHSLWVELW